MQITVQAGDTLGAIADRFGTTVEELLRLNPQITDPNVIFAGQTLEVPGGTPEAGGVPTTPGVLRTGIDYSFGRPDLAAVKEAGYSFAVRYLSEPPDNPKNLSRDEADQLRAAGIDVVSNWEYYGDWDNEFSGGYPTGREYATKANELHLACGGPPNRPIYFSIDFEATEDQQSTIDAYFDGVASVIGLERCGAYGGYYVIQRLFDAGKIRWGWQAYAWSYGNWEPRAQLRQVEYDITVGGADCDADEAWAEDFGQWDWAPAPAPPTR